MNVRQDTSAKRKSPKLAGFHGAHPSASREHLFSFDLRGNLIDMSETLKEMLEYSRQEILGMPLTALLDQDSWKVVQQIILQHVGGGSPGPHEMHALTKTKRAIPLEVATQLVFENGRPVAVRALGRAFPSGRAESRKNGVIRGGDIRSAPDDRQFTWHLKELHRLSTTNYKSLDEGFADFLKTGCAVFGLDTGCVLCVDAEGALVRAVHGTSRRVRAGARLRLEAAGFDSISERLRTSSRSGKEACPRLAPDFRICIATPILVDAELFGMLCFSSRNRPLSRRFSSEERELIELMARGIGRLVLEDRIQAERKNVELLEKNRNRVLEMVAKNQPLRETLRQIECLVESQLPGWHCSVLHECATPRRTEPDAVCEPIFSGSGNALGAIVVSGPPGEPAGPAHSELLRTAASLASIAIEQRQLTKELEFQARHDPLTGLSNRSYLLERLDEKLAEAKARGGLIAVLFIDLDRFKQINDTLGHEAGDRLLVKVAARLHDGATGEPDIVARMGGDEFAVVLNDPPGEEAAARLSRQFLNVLRKPYTIEGRELFVTASIGMSLYPLHGATAEALIRAADAAMYVAKKGGKNALALVGETQYTAGTAAGNIARLDLESALRRALDKSEFELYFQPIVSMLGDLAGFEALLAWNHATLGRLPPAQFIPLAEETGLIVPIGEWVIRRACMLGAQWVGAGLPLKRIAVNVSTLQFAQADFIGIVAAALESYGFPAERLELEITESLVLRDIDESVRRMARLRQLGVAMVIDDFGTGYSSLNYLRRLPVSGLKIDQSFLRDLHSEHGSFAVVESIVSLAHNMRLSVVAEGVETKEELELLRAAGCDEVQGHLFGASLQASEAQLLLEKRGYGISPSPFGLAARP